MATGIPGKVPFLGHLRCDERFSLDLGPGSVLIYAYTGKEDDPTNEKF